MEIKTIRVNVPPLPIRSVNQPRWILTPWCRINRFPLGEIPTHPIQYDRSQLLSNFQGISIDCEMLRSGYLEIKITNLSLKTANLYLPLIIDPDFTSRFLWVMNRLSWNEENLILSLSRSKRRTWGIKVQWFRKRITNRKWNNK